MMNKRELEELDDYHYYLEVSWAIEKEDMKTVQQLVEERPECVQFERYGETLLHEAGENGTPEMIEFLYHSGGDINKSDLGELPINNAVRSNKANNVKMFLKLGAELNTEDSKNNPLFDAISRKNTEIASLLIDAGIDLTVQYATRDDKWWDALSFARYHNCDDIAMMILDRFEKDGIDYDSIEPFEDEIEKYYEEHPDSDIDEEILENYLEIAREYLEDIEKFKQLSKENPEKYSILLAYSYDRFAHYAHACDDLGPADEYYECALRIYQELAEKDPDKYLIELAESYYRIRRLSEGVFANSVIEDRYNDELKVRIELAQKDIHQFGKALLKCYDDIIEYYEYEYGYDYEDEDYEGEDYEDEDYEDEDYDDEDYDVDEDEDEDEEWKKYYKGREELQKQLSDCGVNMDTNIEDTEKYHIIKQYIEEWHPYKKEYPNRCDVYGMEIEGMADKINDDCSVERIVQIIYDALYHALNYSSFKIEECREIAKKIKEKITA